MDESKDIQKTDELSRILDSHSIRTSPFGKNLSGERAYRRAERLVAGIHVLTNHVPQEEPARTVIRETSIALLSNILALRDEMRVPASEELRATQAVIRKLISLARILSLSGYFSPQNTSAVVEALDELGNFLVASQRSSLSESSPFSKEDLMDVRDMGVIGVGRVHSGFEQATRVAEHSEQPIKDKTGIKDISRTGPIGSGSLDRRGQAIIEILKSQGEVGIKDISSNLPEYSEKMIQRELARLIDMGRVRKSGFKRWSRYTYTG